MPERYRMPLLMAMCLIPGLAFGWMTWHRYPDDLFAFTNQLVVRDYLNLWAGGQLAAANRVDLLFQPMPYCDWLRAVFGDRLEFHAWSYPPHLLLLAVPFALLPLVPGFFAWIGATGGLLWATMRESGLSYRQTWAVVLSPAVLENALGGQNGTLLGGAALGGGLLLAGRRPVLAGALLGLLSLKPQLGLLVPLSLLAAREWRTLAWAATFALAYALAGLVAFGSKPWLAYATVSGPFTRNYLEAPFGLVGHFMMVTPFASLRAWGGGLDLAYGVQAMVTVACALVVWCAWRRTDRDHHATVALTLCLAPLATPYAHTYDLVGVALACVLLSAGRCTLALTWLWPSAAFLVSLRVCPGLGPIIVTMPILLAWRRIFPVAFPPLLAPRRRHRQLSPGRRQSAAT